MSWIDSVFDAGSWSLTAGDSGFAAATTPIDTLTAVPLVLRPRSVDGKPLPDHELFDDECVCPGYFLRPA